MNNVIDEETVRYKMEFKNCDMSCSGRSIIIKIKRKNN